MKIDYSPMKAHFKLGQAYLILEDLDAAEYHLKEALAKSKDPANPDKGIREEMRKCEHKMRQQEARAKKTYAKMF